MVRSRRWVRLLLVAALVALVAWRAGPAAVGQAVRALEPRTLAVAALVALVVGAVSTVCSAWRWALVSRALGLPLRLPEAVAASYRAQLLNVSLPLGVAGDAHRGIAHGRRHGDLGRGVRVVVWDRVAGQVVQAGLAVAVLALVPSPLRGAVTNRAPVLVAAALAVAAGAGLSLRARLRDNGSRTARLVATATVDVRRGLLARRVWPGVVAASALAVAGHVTTFAVAARAVGLRPAPAQLVPVALLVLLAAALPLNVAGWGPREGAAAWAFGVVGLGAAQGLVVAAVYGLLVLVAALPGALVLLRGAPTHPARPTPPPATGRATPVDAGRVADTVGGARA